MPVTAQQKKRYSQLLQKCDAVIHRSHQASIKEELQRLSDYVHPDDARDSYGYGGVVHQFEVQLADFFSKPAALFLPTGTLAQNVAMKCYSETARRQSVALHPTSHLMLHEYDAIETLWHLKVKTAGQPDIILRAEDITHLDATDVCALIIETPMRELGGVMPDWDTLVAIRRWCDENQVAMHMDGARIWQTTSFYQRSLQQIAGIFDSVYVSFYKDLNGIAGAALLGETSLIEDARIWARRAGGNPITLYPEVLAAQYGLERLTDKMPEFISYTKTLAQELVNAGFTTVPGTVQAAMFHLKLNEGSQVIADKILDYAGRTGVMVLPLPRSGTERYCISEISIGDQAVKHPPGFWVEHLIACLGN